MSRTHIDRQTTKSGLDKHVGPTEVQNHFRLVVDGNMSRRENSSMDEWKPATIEEVKRIVTTDLRACDPEQISAFNKYAVEPYVAPIIRYQNNETVVVVARKGDEAIYWEDVEEGFSVSPVGADGQILEHWCNQDELRFALNAWIEGRGMPGRFGPAKPID
ncbi:MAG TPA: hypothetical protein VKY85_13225 [Candidatus Angelobacter sp.]|nr:hypothetical protein [Candidatus Angelobacter sp.]